LASFLSIFLTTSLPNLPLNSLFAVDYGKSTAPIACPLKPEVGLHWLAVNGSQPLTAENPSVVIAEAEQQPLSLPKELQVSMLFVFRTYIYSFVCLVLCLSICNLCLSRGIQ